MVRNTFTFDGGEMLTTMGASWFVSYGYHKKIDPSHKNWEEVSTTQSRISVYSRSGKYHELWLQEIICMSDNKLKTNSIGLHADKIKWMAKKLLEKTGEQTNVDKIENSSDIVEITEDETNPILEFLDKGHLRGAIKIIRLMALMDQEVVNMDDDEIADRITAILEDHFCGANVCDVKKVMMEIREYTPELLLRVNFSTLEARHAYYKRLNFFDDKASKFNKVLRTFEKFCVPVWITESVFEEYVDEKWNEEQQKDHGENNE